MTIKTSILIEANGKQAKTEIEAVERAVKKTGTATEELGRKARTGATGTKELGGAAGQAEAKVESLAAAERRAAAAASEMDRSNRRASAATANLVSQGNDIFVMLAAGQAPMQLALQQGTQINQVFAQLGGGMGALRGVGSAIMAMVSPMSLLKIGTIAGVAALTQWVSGAMSAGEEAETLSDIIERQTEATADALDAMKEQNVSLGELRDTYHGAATAVRDLLNAEAERANRDAGRADAAAVRGLAGSFELSPDAAGALDRQSVMNRIDTRSDADGGYATTAELDILEVVADRVLEAIRAVDASAGQSIAEQISAVEQLQSAWQIAANLSGSVNAAEDARLAELQAVLKNLYDRQAELSPVATPQADFADRAAIAANEERVALMREVTIAEAEYAKQQEIASYSANQNARDMLSTLEDQAAVKDLIAAYGADSLQVAQFHVDAEREVQQALVDSLDVADSMKVELMAAWDAANGISAADMASGIGAAADEAFRLTGNLLAALSAQNRADAGVGGYSGRGDGIAEMRARNGESGEGFASVGDYTSSADAELRAAISALNRPARSSGRKKGGGGKSDAEKARDDAIKAAEREQKAVDSLIGSLREEVDVQRLLDPVQQEMRRHRDTLASATNAERAEVEKLITTREAEATAMAAAKEQMDFFKSSGFELFDDLTDGAGGFGDSLESIADRIRQIALEALLLGEGPLAGLLGGGNAASGGLLGMAAKALIPGMGAAATGSSLSPNVLGDGSLYADGGLIHGPGGGRSDDVPIWASSGEFMMNAKATAQNRHLLEAMNAGAQLPGFASGGAIDGSRAASMISPQVTFIDQSTGSKTITREDSVDAQGRPQTKFALADAVGQALSTPGGGAQRVLTQGFGVRRRGSKR